MVMSDGAGTGAEAAGGLELELGQVPAQSSPSPAFLNTLLLLLYYYYYSDETAWIG